jgi:DNA polymerase elongation subunit (family B)
MVNTNMDPIQFQIIDISSDDIPIDGNFYDKEFIITVYGKTSEGKNVVCNIKGYQPYFYMRIPDSWKSKSSVKSFFKNCNIPGNYKDIELLTSYNFYGYNYDKELDRVKDYNFAKISFKSYGDMKKLVAAIQKFYHTNYKCVVDEGTMIMGEKKDGTPTFLKIDEKLQQWFLQEHNCNCVANLYESKFHPQLRFIHEKNIQSCGWVKVTPPTRKSFVTDNSMKTFNVDYEINDISPKHMKAVIDDNFAPFITASFDIECDSSHGDFPNPIKDHKKLAIDIYETYFRQSICEFPYHLQITSIRGWIEITFNGGDTDIQSTYTDNGVPSKRSIDDIMKIFTDTYMKEFKESKLNNKLRDKTITELTKHLNKLENDWGEKIQVKGDPIIQIGTVFHKYGEETCYDRSIIVIGNEDFPDEKICDDLDDINVYECKTEKELLLKWKDLLLHHNPDLITGYNIFGFDFDYIAKRVNYLFPCCDKCKKTKYYSNCGYNCPKNQFYRLGRLMRNKESDMVQDMKTETTAKTTCREYNNFWEKKCKMMSKELSSSGLGDNILKYIFMDGRVIFDIQKEIQKGHSLDSYKLDNVSAHFIKGQIKAKNYYIDTDKNDISHLWTTSLGNIKENDYITILLTTKYGNLPYKNGTKFKVISLSHKTNCIRIQGKINVHKKYGTDLIYYEWCLAKDDVSPQQIFDYHKTGGSAGRAKIAKYCIMDCELCIHLLRQLDIVPNNIGMACVSSVPLSYIFLRGQGIKIQSLVTKECSKKNIRIPTLASFDPNKMDEGFEGAIVLEPTPGLYLEDPITVLDYASLYPNSIIEKNLSHETFICTQTEIDEHPERFNWLNDNPDEYETISYDDYKYEMKGKTLHKIKLETQTKCYFMKKKKKEGIIPIILNHLLEQRKHTRKLIKQTDDENKKKVLDGLQLAYKVTANSVYGQMGAKTSAISFKKIAACTTSIGRERIYDAESGVKEWAQVTGHYPPEVIYGDTDSVFVKFSRKHKDTSELLHGKEALRYCIDCGIQAGKWISDNKLTKPQDLEYEKTFDPFILISKKRYTGDKYEIDHLQSKERTSMGIVMKRRDNAPIVKYVFGNVIEIIMHQKSVQKAMGWLQDTLTKIIKGDMDTSMFIISKSLSGYYKNPDGIAHKVLADRMAERNPGNKPKPNDRIPYIYRVVDESPIPNGEYKNGKKKYLKRKILQGDRIEHPDYIKEKQLDIDYKFYISNQIMNPVKQVLDLDMNPEETVQFFQQFIC